MKNKINLIGNLGENPTVTEFESGSKVAKINLATSETYKDKEGKKVKSTEWHEVKFWNTKADVVLKHLSKGDRIDIEGKLTYEIFEDSNGSKHKKAVIVANELIILSCNKWQEETETTEK